MIRGVPRISDSRLIDGVSANRLQHRQSLLSRLDVEPVPAIVEIAQFDQFQQWGFDVLDVAAVGSCFDPAADRSVRQGTLRQHAVRQQRVHRHEAGRPGGQVRERDLDLVLPGDRRPAGLRLGHARAQFFDFAALSTASGSRSNAVLMEDLDQSGLLDETLVRADQ